jgi:hypothetical protein
MSGLLGGEVFGDAGKSLESCCYSFWMEHYLGFSRNWADNWRNHRHVYAFLGSFQSSFPFSGGYNIPWSGIILGSVLISVGALVVNLGERAAFFKISSEVVSEEINRQLQASKPAICPTCGG